MPLADPTIIQAPDRLTAVRNLCLLDTPADPAFDRLTRLASRILHVPVSLAVLLDFDRQFFKSQVGLPEPWASLRETPLSHSFCQHVVATGAPLIIEDATRNPLVYDNLAIPDLDVIAYAGIPLATPDGDMLGSFCVIDSKPHAWTDEEIEILSDLAEAVTTEINLRAEIIERQQIEEALKRSERFTKQIVTLIPDTVHIYELGDLQNIYSNHETAEFFISTLDDNPDFPVARNRRFVNPEDRSRLETHRENLQYLKDNEVAEIEYQIQQPDGEWRWMENQEVVFKRNPDGDPQQILGITRDITERKEAQKRQVELGIEKEKVHALGSFIEQSSHDIRTAIAIMTTGLHLSQRDPDPEKRAQRLHAVQDQVDFLTHWVEDLQDLFTLAEQKLVLYPTSINSIVEELCRMETVEAAKKNITLEMHLEPGPPDLPVDASQLSRAFKYMVDNAILYTPEGGRLSLQTSRTKNRLLIDIRDTGIGISDEDRPHIFNMFYKANKARTRDGSGPGLGLTMAKQIIDLHHGEISVTSLMGEGSTFTISLPLP